MPWNTREAASCRGGEAGDHGEALIVGFGRQQNRETVAPFTATLIKGSVLVAGEHQLMTVAQHPFRQLDHRDALRTAAGTAERDKERRHVALQILVRAR